jgi:site-specific DNA-methyltransferase (adenine-specific)
MIEKQVIGNATLHHGDCLDVLRTMPDNSVDAIVTDPPYGLSFMGKKWDYDVPATEVWAECLRVLKPGGHLLAFAGTRTQHRMAVRIEDAGFEIRDMIMWCYGSGFPKSMDVSKAIDRAAGAEREVTGWYQRPDGAPRNVEAWKSVANADRNTYSPADQVACKQQTLPATEAARQWQGWGTALKPALEPITMARKPLTGTVAANVLAHGTGALNIDGCRVAADGEQNPSIERRAAAALSGKAGGCMHSSIRAREGLPAFNKDIELYLAVRPGEAMGRWPANLIHDGSDEVLAGFPETTQRDLRTEKQHPRSRSETASVYGDDHRTTPTPAYSDTGSAARFFYAAKASKKDRSDGNTHPTVKPTDLMRYLVRLVTPPGGVLLDPFNGSGSTGKACMLEGFRYIGIEREADYIAISRARIDHAIALRAQI